MPAVISLCVSRQAAAEGGGTALQDKELQEEVTGGSTALKKKSQIKQTEKETALLTAKRDCVQDLFFLSRASFQLGFSTSSLCPHHSLPHPHTPPSPLHHPTLNSEETKGFRQDVLLWMGPGTAR